MLRLTRDLASDHGIPNLCLAGGVALNCVANGKVLRDGALRAHLDPAGGRRCRRRARRRARRLSHACRAAARASTARSTACRAPISGPSSRRPRSSAGSPRPARASTTLDDDAHARRAPSTALGGGKAVGWFQGRMEFGPRALGARSILGDPRIPRCRRRSTSRSSTARASGPSRRRCCARTSPTSSSSTATAPTCCWSPT